MTSRTRSALIGGVLVLALLAMGAGFPTQEVAPKKWAKSVCGAVGGWVDSTQDGATQLQDDLKAPGTSVTDVRDSLAVYLGATAKQAAAAERKIAAAGTPTTPKGKQAAAGLAKGFKKVRVALRKLQVQAKRVSVTNEATALADLTKLQTDVSTEFSSIGDSFNGLESLDPGQKLNRAFKATAACRALG